MESHPHVYMIGGANGAGKTTSALELLPHFLDTYEFVNADEIARGLNPLRPETADIMAGRMMIDRIKSLSESKKSFAFETTCAGRHHVQTLNFCANAGYILHLIFLWLPSPEAAINRVEQRVRQGGHAIPSDTIHRRYFAGLQNLVTTYLPLVNDALIIDGSRNSLSEQKEICVIVEKKANGELIVSDHAKWKQIEAQSKGQNHD